MQGHDDHKGGTTITTRSGRNASWTSWFVVAIVTCIKSLATLVLRVGYEYKICELQINHKKATKFIGVLIRILEVFSLIWHDNPALKELIKISSIVVPHGSIYGTLQ